MPSARVLLTAMFEDRGDVEILGGERRGEGDRRSLEHLGGEGVTQSDAVDDAPLAGGNVQRPDRERIGVRDLPGEIADGAADRSRSHRRQQLVGTTRERHEPRAQLDAVGKGIRIGVDDRHTRYPSGEPPDGEFNSQERKQDGQDEHDEHPCEHSPKSFVSVG